MERESNNTIRNFSKNNKSVLFNLNQYPHKLDYICMKDMYQLHLRNTITNEVFFSEQTGYSELFSMYPFLANKEQNELIDVFFQMIEIDCHALVNNLLDTCLELTFVSFTSASITYRFNKIIKGGELIKDISCSFNPSISESLEELDKFNFAKEQYKLLGNYMKEMNQMNLEKTKISSEVINSLNLKIENLTHELRMSKFNQNPANYVIDKASLVYANRNVCCTSEDFKKDLKALNSNQLHFLNENISGTIQQLLKEKEPNKPDVLKERQNKESNAKESTSKDKADIENKLENKLTEKINSPNSNFTTLDKSQENIKSDSPKNQPISSLKNKIDGKIEKKCKINMKKNDSESQSKYSEIDIWKTQIKNILDSNTSEPISITMKKLENAGTVVSIKSEDRNSSPSDKDEISFLETESIKITQSSGQSESSINISLRPKKGETGIKLTETEKLLLENVLHSKDSKDPNKDKTVNKIMNLGLQAKFEDQLEFIKRFNLTVPENYLEKDFYQLKKDRLKKHKDLKIDRDDQTEFSLNKLKKSDEMLSSIVTFSMVKINDSQFAHGGGTVTVGSNPTTFHDCFIYIVDAKSYNTLQILDAHKYPVTCLLMMDSVTLISGDGQMAIHIWDLTTYRLTNLLIGHHDIIYSLIYIKTDTFASSSGDRTILFWNVSETSPFKKITQKDSVKGLLAINENELISVCYDKTIRKWSFKDDIQELKCITEDYKPCSIAKITKKQFSVGFESGTIKIYSIKNFEVLNILKGHTSKVNQILKISSDLIASVSNDSKLKIWNFKEGSLVRSLAGHRRFASHVIKMSQTKLITAGNDVFTLIWESQMN